MITSAGRGAGLPAGGTQKIFEAATKCFARKGYHATTVAEVACEAGFVKSTIHYYFESKRVLFLELQNYLGERRLVYLKTVLESLPLEEALLKIYEELKCFHAIDLEFMVEANRDPSVRERLWLQRLKESDLYHEAIERHHSCIIDLQHDKALLLQASFSGLHAFNDRRPVMAEAAFELVLEQLTGRKPS